MPSAQRRWRIYDSVYGVRFPLLLHDQREVTESPTGLPTRLKLQRFDTYMSASIVYRAHELLRPFSYCDLRCSCNQSFSTTSYAVVNALPNSRQWDGKRELFALVDKLLDYIHEDTANR